MAWKAGHFGRGPRCLHERGLGEGLQGSRRPACACCQVLWEVRPLDRHWAHLPVSYTHLTLPTICSV
eukprot:5695943-Alexandrium_andersonii.AAC.1